MSSAVDDVVRDFILYIVGTTLDQEQAHLVNKIDMK